MIQARRGSLGGYDISSLANGIYIVQALGNGQKIAVQKLVVQH